MYNTNVIPIINCIDSADIIRNKYAPIGTPKKPVGKRIRISFNRISLYAEKITTRLIIKE